MRYRYGTGTGCSALTPRSWSAGCRRPFHPDGGAGFCNAANQKGCFYPKDFVCVCHGQQGVTRADSEVLMRLPCTCPAELFQAAVDLEKAAKKRALSEQTVAKREEKKRTGQGEKELAVLNEILLSAEDSQKLRDTHSNPSSQSAPVGIQASLEEAFSTFLAGKLAEFDGQGAGELAGEELAHRREEKRQVFLRLWHGVRRKRRFTTDLVERVVNEAYDGYHLAFEQ